MNDKRQFSLVDQFFCECEHALRIAFAIPLQGLVNYPARAKSAELTSQQQQQVAALMRINHTGEIAAQALYRGQASVTRDTPQREALYHAAAEEQDHLSWCYQRLQELADQPSLLAPIWYLGAFAIGIVAGLADERWGLGFIAETEEQVGTHLQQHLQKLPVRDQRSRAILEQMRQDELAHAAAAHAAGARLLPQPIKQLMHWTAGIMKWVSYRW